MKLSMPACFLFCIVINISILLCNCVVDSNNKGAKIPPASSKPSTGEEASSKLKTQLDQQDDLLRRTVSMTSRSKADTCSGSPENCDDPADLCMSSECVQLAGDILSKMDRTADPCNDFYQYACGAYSESETRVPIVNYTNAASDLHYHVRTLISAVLSSEGSDRELQSSAIRKAKLLYESCIKHSGTDEKGRKFFLDLIKDLQLWPLSVDPVSGIWNAKAWNMEESLIVSHSVGAKPFFAVNMIHDPRDKTKYIISLSASGLTFGSALYYKYDVFRTHFLKYFSNIAALIYGQEWSLVNLEHAKILWRFTKSLANIFPSDTDTDNTEQAAGKVLTLNELQKKFKYLNVLKVIRGLLLKAGKPLTMHDEILLKTPKYFESLDKLIARYIKYEPEVLATYVTWTTVHNMNSVFTLFGRSFRAAAEQFEEDYTGSPSSTSSEWSLCTNFAEGALPYAVAELFREKYFISDDRAKLDNVYAHISHELGSSLLKVDWMPIDTKGIAYDRLKLMTWLNGYPDFILDTTKLDKFYEDLLISNDSLKNIIAYRRFDVLGEFKRKFGKPYDDSLWDVEPTDHNLYKSTIEAKLWIPMGALVNPPYHSYFPLSFLYGTTGSHIADGAIDAFDIPRILEDDKKYDYTDDGDDDDDAHDYSFNRESLLSNKSRLSKYQERIECFEWQYSQLNQDDDLDDVNDLMGKIRETAGIDLAYRAYLRALTTTNNKPIDHRLPGLHMTTGQQFFLGYAQRRCESIRKEYLFTYLKKYKTTNRVEVNKALQNNEDFSAEFNCPKTAKMNSNNRCKLW